MRALIQEISRNLTEAKKLFAHKVKSPFIAETAWGSPVKITAGMVLIFKGSGFPVFHIWDGNSVYGSSSGMDKQGGVPWSDMSDYKKHLGQRVKIPKELIASKGSLLR